MHQTATPTRSHISKAASPIGDPTIDQRTVLNEFEHAGQLYFRRRDPQGLELAQVLDGELNIVSLDRQTVAEIVTSAPGGGGTVRVANGWWRNTDTRMEPVAGSIGRQSAASGRMHQLLEAVTRREDRPARTLFEINQPAGAVDRSQQTHTVYATRADLVRAISECRLRPLARRLFEDSQSDTNDQTALQRCRQLAVAGGTVLSTALAESPVSQLFGYRRLRTIAADVSRSGRLQLLKFVLILSVVSISIGLGRIQATGAGGLAGLIILGQHLGVALSTAVLGLGAKSILVAKDAQTSTVGDGSP